MKLCEPNELSARLFHSMRRRLARSIQNNYDVHDLITNVQRISQLRGSRRSRIVRRFTLMDSRLG